MPTIPITTHTGSQPVDAYYVRHGLAVTRMLENQHCWHVTHVASGMSLDTGFYRRQRAKGYQDALLATGIDWTQSSAAVLRLPNFEQTVRTLLADSPRSPPLSRQEDNTMNRDYVE